MNSISPVDPRIKRGKQKIVVDKLTKLAKKMGPGAKLPTARELSRALGITTATLNRSLEHLEGQGIIRCRQGSGIYVDNDVLQHRVGLVFGENIFSSATSPFGSLMIKHCAQRAAELNKRFSFFLDLASSNGVMDGVGVPVHQDLVDALKGGKLDGVIIIARATVEQEAWLRSQGIPVISAESRIGAYEPGSESIAFDYQKLTYLGVGRLMRAGCKTVGLLGVLMEHREMFKKALKKQGLSCKEEWINCPSVVDATPADTHEQQGRDLAEQLLDQSGWTKKSKKASNLPEGILITDDILARGALTLLSERGVVIGKDMLVCTHANKGSLELAEWGAKILRVEFDPADMARAMFDMLELLISGKPHPSPHYVSPVLEGDESRHVATLP